MPPSLRILATALFLLDALAVARAASPVPYRTTLLPVTNAPQSSAWHGASVAADGDYAVVGAPLTDLAGERDHGVAYVYRASSGMLVATLKSPMMLFDGHFGKVVATSGNRVAVAGKHIPAIEAPFTEAVFVFDLGSANPTDAVAILYPPNPATDPEFGIVSLAISGERVVVGEALASGGGQQPGMAMVYDLGSANPTVPVAVLENPTGDADFGRSVAIAGNRVVVGARNELRDDFSDIANLYTDGVGAAYVYDLQSATPEVPVTTLTDPQPERLKVFGSSVAISGERIVVSTTEYSYDPVSAFVFDFSSETPTTPVAALHTATYGEPHHPVAISGTRVVIGGRETHVYDLARETPDVPIAIFEGPDANENPPFGFSVAVAGDHIVVGSPGQDDGGAGASGLAFVFDLGSATPEQPAARLRHQGPPVRDWFASSLAISGNLVIAGARYDGLDAPVAGAAYVFDFASATPTTPLATLRHPTPQPSQYFGSGVAISGTRAVVTAPEDRAATGGDAGVAYGSVHVFDLASATSIVPIRTFNNPRPDTYGQFGGPVAISGDRVLIGAFFQEPASHRAGVVFVYDLASATPTVPVMILENPNPEPHSFFGTSLAVSDRFAVVGNSGNASVGAYVYDLSSGTPTVPFAALQNPTPGPIGGPGIAVALSDQRVLMWGPYSGAVHVFDLGSSTPTEPIITLRHPAPAFGTSAAIADARVVVGAAFDGAPASGVAFVFDLDSATPSEPVTTLRSPQPHGEAFFGRSVAIAAGHVVVGAPGDNTLNSYEGAAYVFGVPIGLPAPEIHVEQPVGTPLLDGFGTAEYQHVSFGHAPPGGSSARTFLVENIGNLALTGLAISIDGANASEFAVSAAPAPAVEPNASTTFTITFTPSSTGWKSATLHLANNDADESPFDIPLAARGVTHLEAWRVAYFAFPENFGPGADTNDLDRDGLVNLLEFATHRDPAQPSEAIGALSKKDNLLEFTYQRAKAALLDGLSFVVEWSDTLGVGTWSSVGVVESVVSEDAVVEEVLATIPAGGSGERFVRLRVSIP